MKLVIDRTRWLRGEGRGSRLLRQEDNKMCCLGFLGQHCGVSDAEMLERAAPWQAKPEKFPSWLTIKLDPEEDSVLDASKACYDIMRTNDNTSLSDLTREATLVEMFANHDIQVEFVN